MNCIVGVSGVLGLARILIICGYEYSRYVRGSVRPTVIITGSLRKVLPPFR